jgi:hypothetical protein
MRRKEADGEELTPAEAETRANADARVEARVAAGKIGGARARLVVCFCVTCTLSLP